ncbi:MAG: hypothetical protein ABI697_07560 [Devosia sp.]
MRSLKLLLLATSAGALMSSTGAMAADLLSAPPVAEAPIVDNSFNWDGAYIGIFLQGQSAPSAYGLGADFGVNALMNGLVIGGDFEFTASTGANYEAQLTGKLGATLGDSAILYAYSGYGWRTASNTYVPLGIGAEFALGGNVGLKTEAQYNFDTSNSAENSAAAKVGLVFHF